MRLPLQSLAHLIARGGLEHALAGTIREMDAVGHGHVAQHVLERAAAPRELEPTRERELEPARTNRLSTRAARSRLPAAS